MNPAEESWQIIDDTEDDAVAIDPATQAELDDRLDRNRIRQVSQLRRSTFRSRSHAVIAMLACGIGALQAGVVAHDRYRVAGLDAWTLSAIGGLLLLAVGATLAAQRIRSLTLELRNGRSAQSPSHRQINRD